MALFFLFYRICSGLHTVRRGHDAWCTKTFAIAKFEESAMAFLVVIYQPIALLLVMFVKWMVTKLL